MPGSESHRPQPALVLLILFALLVILASSAQTALTEAQPQIQPPSALTKPSAPTCPPPCLTPEQEAALVEVRKILQEARQVAERVEPEKVVERWVTLGLTLPSAKQTVLKDLQGSKAGLLREIEQAQFRAGDFSTAATTTQPWYLAFAQVQYGLVEEAVQTAIRTRLNEDTVLALVQTLARQGQIDAAVRLAEGQLAKEQLDHRRYRNEAAIFALLAREQARVGDVRAKETVQRAVKAAKNVKPSQDQALAFVHVARTQAAMGDQTESSHAFRQAFEAALAVRDEGGKHGALAMVAVGQAESGDLDGSGQTFGKLIQFKNDLEPKKRASALAWTACHQLTSGHRAAGTEVFRQAIRMTESLPIREQVDTLFKIGKWQLKAGDREAAIKTLERMLQKAAEIEDERQREVQLDWIYSFETEATGDLNKALARALATRDIKKRASRLAFVASKTLEAKNHQDRAALLKEISEVATTPTKESVPEASISAVFASVARIRAATGDASAALQAADRLEDNLSKAKLYSDLLHLLTQKGALTEAWQFAARVKKDWTWWSQSALRDLARVTARVGDPQEALTWISQQTEDYVRAYTVLGIAEGRMERSNIEDVSGQMSRTPLRGKSLCE